MLHIKNIQHADNIAQKNLSLQYQYENLVSACFVDFFIHTSKRIWFTESAKVWTHSENIDVEPDIKKAINFNTVTVEFPIIAAITATFQDCVHFLIITKILFLLISYYYL